MMSLPQSTRFLIFGGSGFIGSHLCRHLIESGFSSIQVADIKEPHPDVAGTVSFVNADITRPMASDMFRACDVVINLAAIAKEPGYPTEVYFAVNDLGAKNVLKLCEDLGVNTVWFTSTMSAYGPNEDPRFEDSPLAPVTAYGKSKMNAERSHEAWLEGDANRKLLVVRPAVIFGSGENGNFTRLARALKKGFFLYPGRKDTIKACGYVRDLVRSLMYMGSQPDRYLLYNYSYPREYRIDEICDAFCEVGKFRSPIGTFPKPLVLVIAKVFGIINTTGLKGDIHPDRVYKLIRSTNIHPRELMSRGFEFETDLKSALKDWYQDSPSGEFV